MPRNQEERSASWIVDQIFGDESDEAKRYYADRLRIRYTEPKVRDRLKYCTPKHKQPNEKHGGVILSDSESALSYFRNLLLLDELFKRPDDVFKALGSDGNATDGDGKPVSRKVENHVTRNMIRARRYELSKRAEPINSVLKRSQKWEAIPDDFQPHRDDLNEVLGASVVEDDSKPNESWKAKLAEKIIEIEESDEWQNGSPEKSAEKAEVYLKMGLYGLARQQVESEMADHPADPALNYVKAQLLLRDASQATWQAFTHQTLQLESPPISGEEFYHEEQVHANAEHARSKYEQALLSLMTCYRDWDTAKLPNWAYPQCNDIYEEIFHRIIELADLCSLLIQAQCNWKKDRPTDLIEAEDGDLSREIIALFTGKGVLQESHMQALFWPQNFRLLLRYWSLMQRIKPITVSKSVRAWRKIVEESYASKPGGLSSWQWFPLNEVDQIRAEVAWSNPWPEIIHDYSSEATFSEAVMEAKIPHSFFKKADALLAQQQSDRRLWQCMVYEWRNLSRALPFKSGEAFKLCKKAMKRLPWNKSNFSQTWKTRWFYALAICHFEEAIFAWPTKPEEALQAINEVGQLLQKYPELAQREATMLSVIQCDESDDYESLRDLIGNHTHIFTDTDTELIARTWGVFTNYHPLSHELERRLPLDRHGGFAEACRCYEGTLFEKAVALLKHE